MSARAHQWLKLFIRGNTVPLNPAPGNSLNSSKAQGIMQGKKGIIQSFEHNYEI